MILCKGESDRYMYNYAWKKYMYEQTIYPKLPRSFTLAVFSDMIYLGFGIFFLFYIYLLIGDK